MFTHSELLNEAWERLERSILTYGEQPIGTVAAAVDTSIKQYNYGHCFIRDFVPSGLAFLTQAKGNIVANFLRQTLKLQINEDNIDEIRAHMDGARPGIGLMPASFEVVEENKEQVVRADFGERAIGRVTPVDSCLWWIILLRVYWKATGDIKLAHEPNFQQGMRLILDLCLVKRFDMYPTLLVPEGAFMIDRRMGVYERPLEIQALFYAALVAADELLLLENKADIHEEIQQRLDRLKKHIREHYWIDLGRVNEIHRYENEEFGEEVINKFNIYPDSLAHWVADWIPKEGGYLAGNLGPGRMDFRFFALGNLMSIICSLTDEQQSQKIMNLISKKWLDLVGDMPMKICFPALEDKEWELITGCDPKNVRWSYHNGGNWPVLLWYLVAAAQKTGRTSIAERAIKTAEKRWLEYKNRDKWPEYYDGRRGTLVGKKAMRYQTWTVAGYIVAKDLMENPQHMAWISFD
jgi:glycogen debranching enzyme